MIGNDTWLFHALLPVLGFVVGVFGSFTGLGGSIIMIPALTFGFDVPYNTAIGSTLAQMAGMALTGLIRHYKLGHVDVSLALNYLAGSIPGAAVGRRALQELHRRFGDGGPFETVLDGIYLLLLAGASMALVLRLVRYLKSRRHGQGENAISRGPASILNSGASRAVALIAGGFLAGFLSGLLAIGGGIVTVPFLAGILGTPIQTAVGTSVFQIVPMAASATFVSMGTSDLDWTLIGLLLVGSLPGAYLGPWLLGRVTGAGKEKETS